MLGQQLACMHYNFVVKAALVQLLQHLGPGHAKHFALHACRSTFALQALGIDPIWVQLSPKGLGWLMDHC